jgi:hypothetical protein
MSAGSSKGSAAGREDRVDLLRFYFSQPDGRGRRQGRLATVVAAGQAGTEAVAARPRPDMQKFFESAVRPGLAAPDPPRCPRSCARSTSWPRHGARPEFEDLRLARLLNNVRMKCRVASGLANPEVLAAVGRAT